MKCPKCGYLGFEESDKCRNCGYDFALFEVEPDETDEEEVFQPTARAALSGLRAVPRNAAHEGLEIERPGADDVGHGLDSEALQDLPLASPTFPVLAHEASPLPARTPLSVRRAALDRPRSRHTTRVVKRGAPLLESTSPKVVELPPPVAEPEGATLPARAGAAAVDLLLLAAIDGAILYLTAQMAGVPARDVATLPVVPLGAFLLGLNVAYLAAFTASGGQTIGKMTFGLRVVPLSGRLSTGDAMVRVLVSLAGTAMVAIGPALALVRGDRRTLHDMAARTRVIKATP